MKRYKITLAVLVAIIVLFSCGRRSGSNLNSDSAVDAILEIFTIKFDGNWFDFKVGPSIGRSTKLSMTLVSGNNVSSGNGRNGSVLMEYRVRMPSGSKPDKDDAVTLDDRHLSKEGATHDKANTEGQKSGLMNREVVTKNKRYATYEEAREDISNQRSEVAKNMSDYESKLETAARQLEHLFELAATDHNAKVKTILVEAEDLLAAHNSIMVGKYKSSAYSKIGRKIRETSKYIDYAKERLEAGGPAQRLQKQELLDFARSALIVADLLATHGDLEAAQTAQEFAHATADLTVGFIPGVGVYQDVFEARTGNSMLTGKPLSTFDRGIAIVGAIIAIPTGGYGSRILRIPSTAFKVIGKLLKGNANPAVKVAQKIFDSAKNIGFKNAVDIKQNLGVIERWSPNFKTTNIDDAVDINKAYGQPPYLAGSKVVEFQTTAAESFVRVHGPNNQARTWVMRQQDIKGLSSKQIADKFNIPDVPTSISRVDIPSGIIIRTGVVGPNAYGTSKGAIQYEIRMERVPPEWFTKIGDL